MKDDIIFFIEYILPLIVLSIGSTIGFSYLFKRLFWAVLLSLFIVNSIIIVWCWVEGGESLLWLPVTLAFSQFYSLPAIAITCCVIWVKRKRNLRREKARGHDLFQSK